MKFHVIPPLLPLFDFQTASINANIYLSLTFAQLIGFVGHEAAFEATFANSTYSHSLRHDQSTLRVTSRAASQAALSSRSPLATIFSRASGKARYSAAASSHGARIHTSRSSSVVRISGMAGSEAAVFLSKAALASAWTALASYSSASAFSLRVNFGSPAPTARR